MSLPTVDKIWMDGELVDWDKAQVHVLTHALHYGSGVFEGIRCYETADGPAVFRLTEHMERFERSAKMLFMDLGYSVERDGRGGQGDHPRQQAARAATSARSRFAATASWASTRFPRPVSVTHRRAGRGRRYMGEEALREGVDVGVSARGASAASTRCRRRSRPPATT